MKNGSQSDWLEHFETVDRSGFCAVSLLKVFVILCAFFASQVNTVAKEPVRPNIILIMADDLGYAEKKFKLLISIAWQLKGCGLRNFTQERPSVRRPAVR